ncbi:hypothetical protein DV515_00017699, partial [Chloebia gouldiae]
GPPAAPQSCHPPARRCHVEGDNRVSARGPSRDLLLTLVAFKSWLEAVSPSPFPGGWHMAGSARWARQLHRPPKSSFGTPQCHPPPWGTRCQPGDTTLVTLEWWHDTRVVTPGRWHRWQSSCALPRCDQNWEGGSPQGVGRPWRRVADFGDARVPRAMPRRGRAGARGRAGGHGRFGVPSPVCGTSTGTCGDAVGTAWPRWQCRTTMPSLSSHGPERPKAAYGRIIALNPADSALSSEPGRGGSADPHPLQGGLAVPVWRGRWHTCGLLVPGSRLCGVQDVPAVSPPWPSSGSARGMGTRQRRLSPRGDTFRVGLESGRCDGTEGTQRWAARHSPQCHPPVPVSHGGCPTGGSRTQTPPACPIHVPPACPIHVPPQSHPCVPPVCPRSVLPVCPARVRHLRPLHGPTRVSHSCVPPVCHPCVLFMTPHRVPPCVPPVCLTRLLPLDAPPAAPVPAPVIPHVSPHVALALPPMSPSVSPTRPPVPLPRSEYYISQHPSLPAASLRHWPLGEALSGAAGGVAGAAPPAIAGLFAAARRRRRPEPSGPGRSRTEPERAESSREEPSAAERGRLGMRSGGTRSPPRPPPGAGAPGAARPSPPVRGPRGGLGYAVAAARRRPQPARRSRGGGRAAGPVWPVAGKGSRRVPVCPGGAGPARGGEQLGITGAGGRSRCVPVCPGGIGLASAGSRRGGGGGFRGQGLSRAVPLPSRFIPACPVSPVARCREPRAVVGRVGGSAVLGCGLLGAHEARPPLYVIEWVRFGFVLPIFIKFGLYSPRVDPEYAGESRGRGGQRFSWGVPCLHSLWLGQTGCCWCFTTLIPLPEKWGALLRVSGCAPVPIPRGGGRDGGAQLVEGMQIPVQPGSGRDPQRVKSGKSPPPHPRWNGRALPVSPRPVPPGCPGAAGAAPAGWGGDFGGAANWSKAGPGWAWEGDIGCFSGYLKNPSEWIPASTTGKPQERPLGMGRAGSPWVIWAEPNPDVVCQPRTEIRAATLARGMGS